MADGLTATAQPEMAQVLLRLEFAAVTLATIVRVAADGTETPVRNAEPAPVNTTWVGFDHEAPLDAAVSYKATSTQSGTTHASGTVTVASAGKVWLKHPGKPWLNRVVTVREEGVRRLPARRGVLRPIGRADPIVVHDIRGTDSSAITLNLDSTADAAALRTMLADGAPLLVQTPDTWGGESLYLSVDVVEAEREFQYGPSELRHFTLQFDVTGRPPGVAGGPLGLRWDDLSTQTWTTVTGTWDDKATAL